MLIIGVCGKAGSGKDTIADILVRDHGFVKVAFADPLKRICKDIYDFSDDQLWGPSEKRNEPDFRYLHRKAGAHGVQDMRALISKEDRDRRAVTPGTFDKYPQYKGMEPLITFYGSESNYGFLPSPPEDEYLTPRYALQKLGTEWGRDCYAPTWIEYGLRMAKLILSGRGSYTAKHGFDFAIDGGGQYLQPTGVVISDVRFLNEVEGLRAGGAKLLRVRRPSQGLGGARGTHRSEVEQDDIPDDLFDAVLNNDGSLEDLIVLTQGFLSKFQIEQRDAGFETMLRNIDEHEHVVADRPSIVKRAVAAAAALPPPEEFNMPLGAIKSGDVDIIPANESPAQEHLRGMLEARQRDVEAGKILDFDAEQKDVPPFKRKKP